MKLLSIALLFLVAQPVIAQKAPFYDDIQAFKKQDSIKPPQKHAILFVGSSSFTKWTDVQSYFPGYTIINRGFGGSTLTDVIRYANEIIFPYDPKEIVIYCGENDIAYGDTVSAETVFNRFQALYNMIRVKYKTIPVVYISIKPSPSRRKYWTTMIEANTLIKTYLNKQRHTTFINVFDLMLDQYNQPKPEIFLNDSLHMNAKGYTIWQKEIEPYLMK